MALLNDPRIERVTSAQNDDLIYLMRDPDGVPVDKSIENRNLQSSSYGKIYNVVAYGAVGDGVTDDASAINQAVSDIQAAGGGHLYFPGGKTYAIGSPIDCSDWSGNENQYAISGGYKWPIIKAIADIPFLMGRQITSSGDPNKSTAPRINIKNFRLIGNGFAGQIGISLHRVRHSGCSFIQIPDWPGCGLDYGLDYQFALECYFSHCEVSAGQNAIRISYGLWGGENAATAASNACVGRESRIRGNANASGGSSLYIFGSSNFQGYGIVFEGAYAGRHDIEYDSDGNPVMLQGFELHSPHFEHGGTNTMIANVGVYGGHAQGFLIINPALFSERPFIYEDAQNSLMTIINLVNTRTSGPANYEFSSNSTMAWRFIGNSESILDSSLWENGVVPNGATAFGSTGYHRVGYNNVKTIAKSGIIESLILQSGGYARNDGGPLCQYGTNDFGTGTGNLLFELDKGYTRYKKTITAATSLSITRRGDYVHGARIYFDITQDGVGGHAVGAGAQVLDPNGLLAGYDTTANTHGIVIVEYSDIIDAGVVVNVVSGLTVVNP